MPNETEFEAAFQAALLSQNPTTISMVQASPDDGIPYVVIGANQKVQSLEHLLPRPLRRQASASFADVESFLTYVEDFRTPTTRLFGHGLTPNASAATVVAILDYHGEGADGEASRCQHRATLVLSPNPTWMEWKVLDGKQMTQEYFAEFLEDHELDVTSPDGATLLETAKHLEAKKNVTFKSGINLTNGSVQFSYEEETAGVGKGKLTVPTEFTLSIPVFDRGEPATLRAKLRYRIHEGKLTFAFKLVAPREVVEAAFQQVLLKIEQGTGQQVLLGTVTTGG